MFEELSREELESMLRDAALNWLAHDGLWFQAVDNTLGLEKAIETAHWGKRGGPSSII